MQVRKYVLFVMSLVLICGVSLFVAPTHSLAATAVENDHPPCNPTGVHASVTNNATPREDAYLKWCSSGGYFYIKPTCGIESAVTGRTYPAIQFNECFVFVWTTGGTYVTRYGWTQDTHGGLAAWTEYYYQAANTLQVSGYNVSSEVCGTSYWSPSDDAYALGCKQSPPVTP